MFLMVFLCWWRMLNTKCVGDKFEMLMTDLLQVKADLNFQPFSLLNSFFSYSVIFNNIISKTIW